MDKIKNNFFILSYTNNHPTKKIVSFANSLIKKMGYNYQLKRNSNPMMDMNTIEQRINFFHLLSNVLENNIPGQVVEFGSFNGQCAILFQQILQFHQSQKELHLYDSFEHKFTLTEDVKTVLLNNFRKYQLSLPVLHEGLFENTMPGQLPPEIAFAHIDCGFGGDPLQHKEVLLFCLKHLYPRLQKGAICALMDYHDSSTIDKGNNYNPAVKLACDDFFKDKDETIIGLYGNEISHAYFKKC